MNETKLNNLNQLRTWTTWLNSDPWMKQFNACLLYEKQYPDKLISGQKLKIKMWINDQKKGYNKWLALKKEKSGQLLTEDDKKALHGKKFMNEIRLKHLDQLRTWRQWIQGKNLLTPENTNLQQFISCEIDTDAPLIKKRKI